MTCKFFAWDAGTAVGEIEYDPVLMQYTYNGNVMTIPKISFDGNGNIVLDWQNFMAFKWTESGMFVMDYMLMFRFSIKLKNRLIESMLTYYFFQVKISATYRRRSKKMMLKGALFNKVVYISVSLHFHI